MRNWFAVLALLLAPSLFAQTASFVKADTTTQGNWMGVYGSTSAAVEGFSGNVSVTGNSTYTWASSTSDPRALQITGTRIAACWYSQGSMTFNVTANGNVSLYLLDWDTYQGGRVETVSLQNPSSGAVLASYQASHFVNGVYVVFVVTGTVNIVVTNNNAPANAVVSGLFVDAAAAAPKHQVILNWSGTGPFNVYRNGTLLTAAPITPTIYTDTTVVAGQTYSYTVAAVQNGLVSTPTPVTAFTIPSP